MTIAHARLTVDDRGLEWPADLTQPRHACVPEEIQAAAAVGGDGFAIMDVERGPLAAERCGDDQSASEGR